MLCVIMLCVIMLSHYAVCHYAECHYIECYYAQCHGAPGVVMYYLVMMIPSMKRSIWVTAEFFRISSTKQIHSGKGPRVYLKCKWNS